MAQHGGKRPGAGKKPGTKASHTLEAQEGKKQAIQIFLQNLEPIVRKAVAQAKKGDFRARDWLSHYAWGKPTQPIGGDEDNPLTIGVVMLPQRENSLATNGETK